MSITGSYAYVDGQWQKISDDIPTLARPVYFNKGGVPAYDPSARRTFESKQEKRQWLKQHGLREGGIINPDKRLEGHFRNATKPSYQAKVAARQRQAWIAQQGGTQGLLNRLQQKQGG